MVSKAAHRSQKAAHTHTHLTCEMHPQIQLERDHHPSQICLFTQWGNPKKVNHFQSVLSIFWACIAGKIQHCSKSSPSFSTLTLGHIIWATSLTPCRLMQQFFWPKSPDHCDLGQINGPSPCYSMLLLRYDIGYGGDLGTKNRTGDKMFQILK